MSQKQLELNSVTPSPSASTRTKFEFGGSSAFAFASATKVPAGVVDLYNDPDRLDAAPSSLRSSKRRAFGRKPSKQQQQKQNQKQQNQLQKQATQRNCCGNHCSPSTWTFGGPMSSSLTPESLTAGFIRSYGEDHWKTLHDTEYPIMDDPPFMKFIEVQALNNKNKNNDPSRKRRSSSFPLGSPQTSSASASASSSSLSAWTGNSTRVTPNDDDGDGDNDDSWGSTALGRFRQSSPKEPHQATENNRPMNAQPQLTPKMRSILVDWMIELSEHFSFSSSTLHLAVTLVDRVLASGPLGEDEGQGSAKGSGSASGNKASSKRRKGKSNRDPDQWDFSDSDDSCNNDNDSDKDSDNDNDSEDDMTKDTRCYIIQRDRYQLLGATCVWLACKVQEMSAPKASEIAYVSDHIYTTEQIKRMERRICNAVDFNFFKAPTPHQFLFEFLRASLAGCAAKTEDPSKSNACSCDCRCQCPRCLVPASSLGVEAASHSVFRDMAHYLLELGRMPYAPTLRNPSLLAAAAVYLARLTLGIPRTLEATAKASFGDAKDPERKDRNRDRDSDCESHYEYDYDYDWTPTLQHYTGYTKGELRDTVLELHKYQMAAETSGLKATFNKFKSKKYHRVALKTVLPVDQLGFP